MRLPLSAVAVLFLSLAAVSAQASTPPASSTSAASEPGKAPAIQINVDPETQKRENAYTAAAKALTPEQQQTLKSFEQQYLAAAAPDIQMISTGLQLQYCKDQPDSAVAKNASKYESEYGVLRNQLQSGEETQRAALRQKRAAATAFFDQKMLDTHYSYMTQLTLGIAQATMSVNAQKGGMKGTDCADVAQKLDASFAEASKTQAAGGVAAVGANTDEESAQRIAQVKKAAGKGDPDAMTNLAMIELSGTGVPKDVDAGIALLQRAAGTGYERAEYILGLSLATDMLGRAPDKEKAKYWLKKAADQGNKKAAMMLAQVDNIKPSESIDSLRARAEKGDKAAQYDLGSRYSQGLGVDKNPAEAMKWLLMAAGQNYPLAQSDVAVLLINADRVAEGVDWMTKAANNGVSNSQFELAGLYRDGKVVPKDLDKARYWYRKAADAGDSRARKMLDQLGNP